MGLFFAKPGSLVITILRQISKIGHWGSSIWLHARDSIAIIIESGWTSGLYNPWDLFHPRTHQLLGRPKYLTWKYWFQYYMKVLVPLYLPLGPLAMKQTLRWRCPHRCKPWTTGPFVYNRGRSPFSQQAWDMWLWFLFVRIPNSQSFKWEEGSF